MNALNKLLISINVLVLAILNYLPVIVAKPIALSVLGSEVLPSEFEVTTTEYKLKSENGYLTAEILAGELLQQSQDGSFMLSQAYTPLDKDEYFYKIFIKEPNQKNINNIYELNVKNIRNQPSKIYFYKELTTTGSQMKEIKGLQGNKLSDINCQTLEEKDVLIINIDQSSCLDKTAEKYIDLKYITIDGNKVEVNKIVSSDLLALLKAAYKNSIELKINSAYRSYENQETLKTEMEGIYGEAQVVDLVAQPGKSEHQLGTALDFTSTEIGSTAAVFGDTKAYRWLLDNAWEYGFVLSYPSNKTEATGYTYEPWHWRYVGKMHSKIFKDLKDLSLNEYLKLIENSEKLY